MKSSLRLALRHLLFSVAALLPLGALAAPQLIKPHGGPTPRSAPGVKSQAVPVQFNAGEMRGLRNGDEVELTLPNATKHAINFDLLQDHGNGVQSWIGHYKNKGARHRVIITSGPAGSYGTISTPQGNFRLMPGDGHDWLVDMLEEQKYLPIINLGDDVIRVAAPKKAAAPEAYSADLKVAIPGVDTPALTRATPSPQAMVDILFVVTQALADNLGPTLATRMAFLVTTANTAYADSEIAITLRLVHTAIVTYTDAGSNNPALDDITDGLGVFAGVEALRTQYGADMVALLRNGNDFGGSGLAWAPSGALSAAHAGLMYSVTTGCVRGCESVLIHEIGHNLGNMHDRATAAWQQGGTPTPAGGRAAYSFGYAFCSSGALTCDPNLPNGTGGACLGSQPECTTGNANLTGGIFPGEGTNNFSDIMSYFHASTASNLKFSNPNVNCEGDTGPPQACGVDGTADTARSMNENRTAASAMRASVAGIQFSAPTYSGAEGGTITFTVSRLGTNSGAVSVSYATSNVTATAGLDYTARSGTISWADGDGANKTVVVNITTDTANENTESFRMTLTNPAGGAQLGSPAEASGIITSPFPSGTFPGGFTTTGAGGAWTVATDQVFAGSDSLKSGLIFFGNSDLTYTGEFAAGVVSFAYRVSSHQFVGFFQFMIDGVQILESSGESGWVQYSGPIAAGTHTLTWRYAHTFDAAVLCSDPGWTPDAIGGVNCAERAWIDDLVVPIVLPVPGIALISSANPANVGQPVALTATLTGGSGTATGFVRFRANGTTITGCSAVAVSVAGTAACTTSALAAGSNSVTAQYSGDRTYATITGTPLTQTVNLVGMKRYDFNGDARSDVLWRDPAGVPTFWHLNGASITSGNIQVVSTGTLTVSASFSVVGVGDFNGDGKADILLRNATSGSNVIWHLDGSTITAGKVRKVSVGNLPNLPSDWTVIGTGDFNGDGKSDILWRDPTGVPTLWNINGASIVGGNITIVSQGTLSLSTGFNVHAIGDFNGDGKADVLWRKESSGSNRIWHLDGATITAGKIRVLNNSGLTSLDSTWSISGVGDFNGDGKSDLLWRDPAGQGQVWNLNGAAIVATQVTVISTGTVSTAAGFIVAGVGDYNGDGKTDVLFRNPTSGSNRIWHLDSNTITAGKVRTLSAGNIPSLVNTWTAISTRSP